MRSLVWVGGVDEASSSGIVALGAAQHVPRLGVVVPGGKYGAVLAAPGPCPKVGHRLYPKVLEGVDEWDGKEQVGEYIGHDNTHIYLWAGGSIGVFSSIRDDGPDRFPCIIRIGCTPNIHAKIDPLRA